MKTVKVARDDLLTRLKVNREKHHELFVETLGNYRKVIIEHMQKNLDEARQGGEIRTYISLQPPEDHSGEYDAVIEMLKMSIENEIDLDARDFHSYVLDQWQWTEQTLLLNSTYAGMARR